MTFFYHRVQLLFVKIVFCSPSLNECRVTSRGCRSLSCKSCHPQQLFGISEQLPLPAAIVSLVVYQTLYYGIHCFDRFAKFKF